MAKHTRAKLSEQPSEQVREQTQGLSKFNKTVNKNPKSLKSPQHQNGIGGQNDKLRVHYMLNYIQFQELIRENISLAKHRQNADNKILSQNELAVMPSGYYWLFLCPLCGIIPPFRHLAKIAYIGERYRFMVWLILQNKPLGEYAKRLLIQPRVRPHHPILGLSTQNELGA